jgi:hypothetical protein
MRMRCKAYFCFGVLGLIHGSISDSQRVSNLSTDTAIFR